MYPFESRDARCTRCAYELEGGEEGCPGCGFNPRQQGLRVSMGLLLVVVGSMTILTLTMTVWTGLEPYLAGLAAVSFGLAIVTFVVSVLATPSRFGFLFTWF